MPLITGSLAFPVLLKTGAAAGNVANFAATAAGTGGASAAVTGGKVLGAALLAKGVSAAKGGVFTNASAAGSAGALHAGGGAAAAVSPLWAHSPAAVAVPGIISSAAVPAVAATGPAAASVPTAGVGVGLGSAAAQTASASPVASAMETVVAHGRQLTMIATVVGIMLMRALINRYCINPPTEPKNRLVRRVSRWAKEEIVAVESEEPEFSPVVMQRPERRRTPKKPAASSGRGPVDITDVETTASTLETQQRRSTVSYVRRNKGKLHRFL